MKIQTIRENHIFRRLYHRGKCKVTPALVVYWMKNRSGTTRVGLTVTNKIGNAPCRNRCRRIMRAALARVWDVLPEGTDIVLVARGRCKTMKSTALAQVLEQVFGGDERHEKNN